MPRNESMPQVNAQEMQQMIESSYQDTADTVLGKFELGLSPADLKTVIDRAYGDQWHNKEITPLRRLDMSKNLHILELGHGPTFAFKNVALELLGRYLDMVNTETLRALGASSGDTINAAHYAVNGSKHLSSIFLLPDSGPSNVQMLQALANDIRNAMTILVSGDFDITQAAIKKFNSPEYAEFKKANNFISFNSIQILRLLAQVVYYFRAYAQMVKMQAIRQGDEIDFSVPSGNFGDALAGHWAREMGLPIRKINVATNENDVLHRFLETGVYRPQQAPDGTRARAIKTRAPSQDITISSNFERALFWACNGNSSRVRGWMQDLEKHGLFRVDSSTLGKLRTLFTSSRASDENILATQRCVWNEGKQLIDGHTATGIFPYLLEQPNIPTVCLSTSHPIQFTSPEGIPPVQEYAELVTQFQNRKPQEGVQYLHTDTNIANIKQAVEEAVRITNRGKDACE